MPGCKTNGYDDVYNCGKCGTVCKGTEICNNGVCQPPSCPGKWCSCRSWWMHIVTLGERMLCPPQTPLQLVRRAAPMATAATAMYAAESARVFAYLEVRSLHGVPLRSPPHFSRFLSLRNFPCSDMQWYLLLVGQCLRPRPVRVQYREVLLLLDPEPAGLPRHQREYVCAVSLGWPGVQGSLCGVIKHRPPSADAPLQACTSSDTYCGGDHPTCSGTNCV